MLVYQRVHDGCGWVNLFKAPAAPASPLFQPNVVGSGELSPGHHIIVLMQKICFATCQRFFEHLVPID